MREAEPYATTARYNRWMNVKLYAAAATLDDEAREADRGAFFKSIHHTLDHLVFADRIWIIDVGPTDLPWMPGLSDAGPSPKPRS